MSDTTSTDSIIRKRERALAWFTAASATYLDLGLTTEQRICLYEECLGIAQEQSDLKLLFLCANSLTKLIEPVMDNKTAEMIHLANSLLHKGGYDEVISYSEKCLSIAQESGDKVAEINAYLTLGIAHFFKKQYDEAISYSEKCLSIAQESGDKAAEMHAYMMLGNAHLEKEEYDDAILYSKKSLAIARESGCKVAEMGVYMTLGFVHFQKEEYDDAILCSKKSLDIARESGCKVAEMRACWILGNVNLKKEEYDDAYSWITESMTIARDLKDDNNSVILSLCLKMIHKLVGITEGDEDISIPVLENTLSYAPKIESLYRYSYYNYNIRYMYHIAQHEYEQAISCLEEAEVTAGATYRDDIIRSNLLSWLCMGRISETYLLLGQYDKCVEYQQKALDVARKEGSKLDQAMSHFSLGEVYCKLEQFENAEKSFKESLKCYELIFDGLKQNDRFKIAFPDQFKKAYKMLLKVLIETNKKEEALVLSDHYRAKALKDLLVSSYGMKKEQVAKEGLQYVDVQSLVSNRNYTLLFYSTCFDDLCSFLVEAGNELEFSFQKNFDQYLETLVDKTFDEMKVKEDVDCEDRSLDKLTQLLTRPKEKRLSEQCRSTCGSRGNPSVNSDESSLTSGLEILYHKLIHNIKCLIIQDEIVIIPEGPLCKLPFAALRNPDTGHYLSQTKRIRMAPSMASLKLLQEYPEEHHSCKDALIIGAAVVGRVILNGVETEIPTLIGVLEEAIGISGILGVKPLLGAMATKPVVIKRLQEEASVVHIAGHGNLEKATIVLAPSPEIRAAKKIPDEEDYMLTMADVQQAQVRAQLVVLSCCDSGRGEIKAEGVVGMCRAFLASGARAVVGSLWAVDDDATWIFMETFYTYLKEGKSASTSLHLTMNDIRRNPQYSEPKYWAPFFLMGDDVTIQFGD